MKKAVLIAFGGLPGTGKTTLAKAVAEKYAAVYLRVDTIEQALIDSESLRTDVGVAGYLTAYRLAEENLRLGNIVVADSANALQVTRAAWTQASRDASADPIEIEVICSNLDEHQRRIETRPVDIKSRQKLIPLTWKSVCDRTYEKWSTPHIVIDTANQSVTDTQQDLMDRLAVTGLVHFAKNDIEI